MTGLNIDRMRLVMPGLSEDDGRRLALRLAALLANAGGLPAAGDIPTLRLDVTGDPREGVPHLAGRIIGELLRQLQRVP